MSFDRRSYGPEENLLVDPDDDGSYLTRWRRSDANPIVYKGYTWGQIVFNPFSNEWDLYASNRTDFKIYRFTSDNLRQFNSPVLALSLGAAGTWDGQDIDVAFVWYESGQSRPWRMIYAADDVAGSIYQIGLATSVDGEVPIWERKDILGNTLTNPVIEITADWDYSIDFGGLIKVHDTYYLYYNSFAPRNIGLATSTNLTDWTKHASNPLFIPTVGEDIVGAVADDDRGRFCADIVRWDTKRGNIRYVMFVIHYEADATLPAIEIYTCPNPIFLRADRTYVGKMFRTSTAPTPKQCGASVTNCDTPRIITRDIYRNVLKDRPTGQEISCAVATVNLQLAASNWNMELFTWHDGLAGKLEEDGTLDGAKYVNICTDLPVTAPLIALAPKSTDSNVRALWKPGVTKTWMDLSGNNIHLVNRCTSIDENGGKFIPTTFDRAYRVPTLTTDQLVTILEGDRTNWSVEWSCTFASQFATGARAVYCHQSSSTNRHFYIYISGGAVNYTLTIQLRSGAATKTATVLFPVADIVIDTEYTFAVCQDKTNGKIYFFKNGVLLNAGGSAFNWTIDNFSATNPPLPLSIGSDHIDPGASPWSGYMDEIRVSNICRYTANYTPVDFVINYQSSGQIFTGVFDALSSKIGDLTILNAVTPAGTTITIKARNASSLADQSVLAADFTLDNPTGRYHQYLITLATTDPTVTPSIKGAIPYSYEDGHNLNGAYSDHDLEQIDLEDHWH